MAIYKSKNKTKDGRAYFFRIKYKDILGEVHDYSSPKFLTKKEASISEAEYKLNLQNADINKSITIKSVFNDYILYKSKRIKPQSINIKKVRYNQLKKIEKVKIDDLNVSHLNLLTTKMDKDDLSINYKNSVLSLLKEIIKYSSKYYNTNNRILDFIESYSKVGVIKKEMNFFTLEEYLEFEKNIDDIKYKAFFEVLYYLGLRVGEARAITFADIVDNNLIINKTITDKEDGKSWAISTPKTKNSIRQLPIPKKVLESLKTIKNDAIKYDDYSDDWFVFGYVKPISSSAIRNNEIKYCKNVGKIIRIHDFRHSCASLLVHNGASINLISRYLGHSNITTTLNTYTHLYKSELYDITKLIDEL